MKLDNISKDITVDNMKKTGFCGQVYDFSIDYDNINISDIKNIHDEKTQYRINVWNHEANVYFGGDDTVMF